MSGAKRTKETRKPWEFGWEDDASGARDTRPYWECLDPRDGLSPSEAFFHFVDRRSATELYEMEFAAYGIEGYDDPRWFPHEREKFHRNSAKWRWLLTNLTHRLEWMLLQRDVIATGYSNHGPLDAPRQVIAPGRWRDVELDAQNATASSVGLEITQILIFPVEDSRRTPKKPAKSYSAAALRKWYIDRIDTCHARNRMPSREVDYVDANDAFNGQIPRRDIEALRRELAPSAWKRRGRRRRSPSD